MGQNTVQPSSAFRNAGELALTKETDGEAAAIKAGQAQGAVENGAKQRRQVGLHQQHAGEIMLNLQQQLGLPARGDVKHGPGAAMGLAISAALDHPTPDVEPGPLAAVAPDAVFGLEAGIGRKKRSIVLRKIEHSQGYVIVNTMDALRIEAAQVTGQSKPAKKKERAFVGDVD